MNSLLICISTVLSFHIVFIFKDVHLKVTDNITLNFKEVHNKMASDTANPCRSLALSFPPYWLYPHGARLRQQD